jgi:alpha-L-fucosidase 2
MLSNINWPDFLSQHDLVFTELPKSWQEAPHFGNAMVGSMIYFTNNQLKLEIFRSDISDHRDESNGWTAYSRPHYKIGFFTLEIDAQIMGCQLRKSLWNAELTGTISTDKGSIEICHFTHSQDMAIVTELTSMDSDLTFTWNWHPYQAETTRPGYPSDQENLKKFAQRYGEHYLETLNPAVPNPSGELTSDNSVKVWEQKLAAGGQFATAWHEDTKGNKSTQIVTISNTYPQNNAKENALLDIENFIKKNTKEWISEHREWWHQYYPQSYLTLPDKKLETLYWQTIYRYGCQSRSGRYYVDTAGLWFQGGQWPYTTHDWNTQAAHWGVYTANRLDQGKEIVNRIHQNSEHLINNVYPEEWREDSSFLQLSTAGDFIGSRRSDMRYYDCVGCLPWLLHNAWWQYRYSMDKKMLREQIFPVLRRSINFYLHISYLDNDDKMHLKPTYSPETAVCKDANFDLALFKWGCYALIESCKALGIEDPLLPRWREATEKLIDFPTDHKGFMLGSETTAWDDHRHLSHLMMIYPLYLVNIEQNKTYEILSKSCELVHNSIGGDGEDGIGNTAMVHTHAGPIASAIGDGDRALESLKRIQSELHANGLWSCSNNPCIESTLSLVNNIQDMLIQSWSDPTLEESGPIRLFPALPQEWKDLEFHNFRTEGAFLISAKLIKGKIEWVNIKSLAGEPCRIKIQLDKPKIKSQRDIKITNYTNNHYDIDLHKDEEVLFYH